MGKMKAQAKKIKDSLTKHSPGDNHDHIPDDHDLDKEEDEEEEIVEDPEIHGAPSTFVYTHILIYALVVYRDLQPLLLVLLLSCY